MNSADPQHRRLTHRTLPLALLALAVFLYAAFFSYLTLQRYHAFESRALDMGNLNQAIWNTAHGDLFRLTNQEQELTNRLGYHVEPILLPIALLYRVYPSPEFLLVLQAVIVSLGAIPLYALARRRSLGDWLGLAFAVAFLLNPTIQAANWLEFHPVTLAPTFLMAAFYFLIAGRTGWFITFAILSASCKEEIGLLVAMMGLYAWLALRRPRLGLATAVLAGGWSLLAVLGIQAVAAGGNIHWGRYAYLGEGTGQKVVSLVTRPDLVLAQLQKASVFRYFFELLLPVGFTALLAPEVLLLALPSVAINLLADFSPMHQVTRLMYAAPVLPFVMLAAVMGIARAKEFVRLRYTRQDETGVHAASPAWFNWSAAALVLGGALIGQRLWGYLPGSGNYLALTVTEHHGRAQAVIDQIPPGAAVSAQDRLNPHVSGRRTVYIFPRVDDADMIFLDVTGPAWPQHPSDLRRTVDELLAGDFGVAAADDGYLLLQRGATAKTLPPEFYNAWQAPAGLAVSDILTETGVVFGDERGELLALRGYTVGTDRYGELVVTLAWEALQPIEEELRFYIGYLDEELQPYQDSRFYQPAAVLWYPTSTWTPGTLVLMQTLPWTLETDAFVLGVGVYAGETGWEDGHRLRVQQIEPSLPVLDGDSLVRLGGYARESAEHDWTAVDPVQGAATRPVDAAFAGGLSLTGATMPVSARSGETVSVDLYWQAAATPATDTSVFVQVLDAAGANMAQWDGPPADHVSMLPASTWPPGWQGTQHISLLLPETLAPGVYTVISGMYDWQTGERLPVNGTDSVTLGSIEIGD